MPRDFDLDFDDDDLMQPRRQAAPRQQRPQQRPQQQRPQRDLSNTQGLGMDRMDRSGVSMPRQGGGRKKKNQTRSIIILVVEIVLFVLLLVGFFVLKSKIVNGDAASSSEASSEEGGSSGGVNVESDNFSLTCTKVQLANDADGNPAALIYFTFVNKTDTPLSMNDVFPPSVKQNGVDCAMNAVLTEEPAEVANHDTQISGGQSLDCCYAVSLQDFTSTLTLTIHDNYETFSDIGSTEIPLS